MNTRNVIIAAVTAFAAFALACATSSTSKRGPNFRETSGSIEVYLGAPPGGIKRVIGTVYAEAHSQTDAVEALAREAERVRADAIYGVREADLPGVRRTPGSPGTGEPSTGKGGDSTFGDFGSERHVRTWQATAVVLEPAAPVERATGEKAPDAEMDDSEDSSTDETDKE